jgi:NitT/TauT family transport system permease protein
VVRRGFFEWDNLHELLDALWSSVRVAGIGLAISVVLGVALATLMSQSKLIERATFPLMVALQAMPILTLVPMIAIIFGSNQTSRVIVCVLITIFPIVLNTLFGLVSGDPGLHDLITLHHGGRITRLRKVMFPSALPAMFAGLRISAGLSVIGAIVGDFFFGKGEKGLGQLIRQYASNSNDIPVMYATTLVAATLGIVVFLLFGVLQHAVIGAWYDSKSGGGR